MRSPKETHDKRTAVTDHSRATPMPRRHVACQRCRRRKQRCDGLMPACANCCRAGVECVQGVSSSQVSRNHLHYLENLVRELESQDRTGPVALPSTAGDNDSTSTAAQQISLVEPVYPVELHNDQPAQKSHEHIRQPQLQSPSVSLSGSMAQDQPLAQEAGLLSLANASDPKYLGPSSGFPYARLIYASAPQSQGLSLSFRNHPYESNDSATAFVPDAHSAALPPIAECQQYAEAFFEVTLFLPFMLHDDVFVLIDHLHGFISAGTWSHRMPVTIAFSQVFLLLSIGARHLETKLKAKFDSSKLYASGMQYANRVTLYDSVEGVQTLLLITLDSFYNPKGLNAWFLLHTIISSCLDMGLQRRENYQRDTESDEQRKRRYLRSGIFWSAYSLDRTLTTTLGRPLTLRDEAIDVDFPGVDHGFEVEMGALEWAADNSRAIEAQMQPYVACIYGLRFDRIVAEIKLMLYRVSRSPRRFPWPADITRWQHEVEASCRALLEEVERRQRGRQVETLNPISLPAVQKLQLKYHQCLMLLHRPSPQNPRPGREATQTCFNSALKIIRISADLHRFTNMDCTWLAAHSIFVAAVTIFYCLWTNPDGIPLVTPTGCLEGLETAHELLKYLSETWSVANDACEKLSSLLPVAKEVHDMFFGVASYPANYQTAGDSQGHPHSAARKDGLNNDRQMEYWPSQGTSALVDELGVLRELFDLEWLDNVNLDTIPPAE